MKAPGGTVLLVALLTTKTYAWAAAPDWLRAVVSAPLPSYAAKTEAVVLLDDRVITVKDSGEIKTNRRLAIKILRSEGSHYGVFRVAFDNDTKLTFLKAWSIPAGQAEYEVKEKEAVETGYSGGSLYSELRHKIISVPASDPGSVVAFEYEQRDRPFLLQHVWDFQQRLPARRARLVLQLPAGWEFKAVWRNFPVKQPSVSGNQWSWELENVAAVDLEAFMPALRAVAGHMALTYLSTGLDAAKSHANWSDVGAWYGSLAAPRLAITPEVARKAAEVTAGAPTQWKKIEALAAFVQRQIRYVSIPIGIGSHQPHAAAEVLANRYGDCKDKATLLKAMLKELGIDSYYMLVHSERGAVNPEFASVLNFNHVILAIREPAGVEGAVSSRLKHPAAGDLVVFDPTDPLTPLGILPDSEQYSHGLLVRDDGSDLVHLPLHASGACRMVRIGSLKLLADGSLTGVIQEIRWGRFAVDTRAAYRRAEGTTQAKVLENFLGQSLGQFQLTSANIQNLDSSAELTLTFTFTAPNYGKNTGPLLLLRPRVLGRKAMSLGEKKDRQHSVNLSSAATETDSFEIELPAGYEVDELPTPVVANYSFAEYISKIEIRGSVLRYERHYTNKQVEIPKEKFDDFWNFQQLISADESSYVVLRKKL